MKWGSRGSGSLCRGFWRLVFLRHSNNPVMGEGGAAYKLSVVLLIVLATAYTLVQGFPQLMALQESRVQKPAVKRLMGVNCSDISVLDVRGWRLKDLVTAVSLQGLVNRGAPRLYLVYSDADLRLARYTIEALLGCRSLHWAGLEGLLERYRGLVRGVIVYDPRLPDTVNLALTLAGLEDAIVVHPDNLEWLESLGFKVLRDLRGRYGSKLEVYEEVYKLLPYTNTTSIAILKAGVVNMADYAVEHRMAIIDLSPLPENAAERGLLERILEAHPGRLAFGFFPGGGRGERAGVELLSRYGKTLIVADYASSLSFTEHLHSYIKPGTPTHRAPRAFKPEPGGVYAAIILSDGDNIGFLQHILLTKSWWYNPLRGSFPMGWTVNPWLAGLAPNLLSLLESQAAGSDELVAGVAVAGHMDSEVMPAEALGDLALRVAPLVREAGLQALLSWDPLGHRGFEYFKWVYRYFYPTIRWSDYGYPGFSLWEGRPVIYTIYLKRASFKEVVDSVLNNVGSRPLMLAFLVDVWSFHNLSQVAELAEYLESRGVTLVGPLELAEAVREYYGVYYNSTTRPWTRVGEAGIRLTASDCGDGRGPVYVRVYGRDSGELLALLKVDPYIEAVQGGFWASEVECRLVRASSDGFTYYFKGRGVEVVKTYRVKGPLVVVSVTVRGGFQSILDVALDELDTIT
nr:hypothetical protein [Desulfurococcales archaeon]